MRKQYDEIDEEYDGFQEDTTSVKVVIVSQVIILVLAFLVGGGFYLWKSSTYADVFLPGTIINQISCGNMTVEQVEERLADQVEQYDLTLIFKDDEKAVIEGKDIDYEYVSSGEVRKLLKNQNKLLWITGYFKDSEYSVGSDIVFDLEKLKQKIVNLGKEQALFEVLPQGAYIHFSDGRFKIVDEVEGNALDDIVFQNEVISAVRKSQSVIYVEEVGAYIEPEFTNDNSLLLNQINQLNNLANASITYTLPEREVVLDGATIMTWLQIDENGNYYKDDYVFREKIAEFVDQLAKDVDTIDDEKIFLTTSGLEVTVPNGGYGWKIDCEEEIKTLTKNIENLETVTREPVYSKREKYMLNNGFGFTYVEINLTEQHLYYYEEGEIVLDSKIVSGNMTRDWYTPEGIYFLESKQRNRTIDGAWYVDGEFVSSQNVNYWIGLRGDIGIHDASWRVAFGGDYYKETGSYGTIELPSDKAAKLYSLIDSNTPIVCVYNKGYSLRPSEPMPTPTPTPTPTPSPTPTPEVSETPTPTEEPSVESVLRNLIVSFITD